MFNLETTLTETPTRLQNTYSSISHAAGFSSTHLSPAESLCTGNPYCSYQIRMNWLQLIIGPKSVIFPPSHLNHYASTFFRFGHNHWVDWVDQIHLEGTTRGKNKHGCSVPINIWILNWEGLSVMVTELKEDHQHTVPMKGEKSNTSPLQPWVIIQKQACFVPLSLSHMRTYMEGGVKVRNIAHINIHQNTKKKTLLQFPKARGVSSYKHKDIQCTICKRR